MKHINFERIIIVLMINVFFISSSHALGVKESIIKKPVIKTIFIKNPTGLAAKSFAVKTFGRNIKILSNKLLESDGCFRIVVKTKDGDRETLKICKE